MTEIKGWHVLTGFILAFGVIVTVNLTLAFNAVRTFPGLEVKNSYVASQVFDENRDAQLALGWDVSADVTDGLLRLEVLEDGSAITPEIVEATFGRATSVMQDQVPEFTDRGSAWVAPVEAGPGNWNLRIKMLADDGTLFQQRIVVRVHR